MEWLAVYFIFTMFGIFMTVGAYDTQTQLEKEKDKEEDEP